MTQNASESRPSTESQCDYLWYAIGFFAGLKIVHFVLEAKNREEEAFQKFLREYDEAALKRH